jgi:hypothetical protein
MRISGYGEFQQMRKTVQKDDAQSKDKAKKDISEQNIAGSDDAVQISGEARVKIKMRQASDFREAKVADVKERLDAGTLVTPESLKRGTSRMLNDLISGEL